MNGRSIGKLALGPEGRPWPILVFSLPIATGLILRLARNGLWFTDFRAIRCGGELLAQGRTLYDPVLSCPDPGAAAFVYGPWVARLSAAIERGAGPGGEMLLYAGVFVAAVVGLAWLVAGRGSTPGAPLARAAGLGILPGGAVIAGNVAVILHALVAFSALQMRRRPWLLMAAIALAASVKPVFLTYLALFILDDRPWRVRARNAAVTLALGLAPTLLFVATAGPAAGAWWSQLTHFVNHVSTGDGLFGWMEMLGVESAGLPAAALAVSWAGVVTLAGVAVVEAGELGNEERMWVGLACGALANPRLMSPDLWLLAPGLLAIVSASGRWLPWVSLHGQRLVIGAFVLGMAGAMSGLRDLGARLAILILAGLLLTTAAASPRVLGRRGTFAAGEAEAEA